MRLINILLWLNGGRRMYDSATLTNWFIDSMGPINALPYRAPRFLSKGWESQLIADITCFFKAGTSQNTIFFLHGGGYNQRPTIFHFRLMDKIQKLTGAHIIMPLYPLAPNHTYKDAYDKVLTIYQQTRLLAPNHCFTLLGDSAGGGLSLGLFMVLKEAGLPLPDHIVLIAPCLDVNLVNPGIPEIEKRDRMLGSVGLREMGKRWAGGTDTYQYRISPIYGDLTLIDDVMIVAGTHDILYPDAALLRDKLERLNKKVTFVEGNKMPHDYPLMPTSEADQAIEKICSYINERPCLNGDKKEKPSL